MQSLLYQAIPLAVMFGGMIIPLVVALWLRRSRKKKRSPLTLQLLRAPGETLLSQIDETTDEILTYLNYFFVFPLLLFSMYMSLRFFGHQSVSWTIYLTMYICFTLCLVWKFVVLYRHRQNLQLGLDCERAVGQELNQLMLEGFRVFHDFPAEGFNIDHIVVGESGVFAVETKGRAKPLKGDVKIVFDGEGLQFPTHYDKKPVNQARRQADWLEKWLTSAVGAPVSARPVLVYPGWYIDRKKPGLLIHNGKNPQALYKNSDGVSLPAEMIQRIAHQLEQRCRDVEPVAYRKEKK